jgi:hypothetical protein
LRNTDILEGRKRMDDDDDDDDDILLGFDSM